MTRHEREFDLKGDDVERSPISSKQLNAILNSEYAKPDFVVDEAKGLDETEPDIVDEAYRLNASSPWHGEYHRWNSWERIAKEGVWWTAQEELDPLWTFRDRFMRKRVESAKIKKQTKRFPVGRVLALPSGQRSRKVKRKPLAFVPKLHGLNEYNDIQCGPDIPPPFLVLSVPKRYKPFVPSKTIRHYSKRCVICDGPGYPHTLFNPEVETFKVTPVSVDLPTGQFICRFCMSQIKKQNARLIVPDVDKEMDARGRIRVSEATNPDTLFREFQEECPALFSQLVRFGASLELDGLDEGADIIDWYGGEGEFYIDGSSRLGNGGFWRKSGKDALPVCSQGD